MRSGSVVGLDDDAVDRGPDGGALGLQGVDLGQHLLKVVAPGRDAREGFGQQPGGGLDVGPRDDLHRLVVQARSRRAHEGGTVGGEGQDLGVCLVALAQDAGCRVAGVDERRAAQGLADGLRAREVGVGAVDLAAASRTP